MRRSALGQSRALALITRPIYTFFFRRILLLGSVSKPTSNMAEESATPQKSAVARWADRAYAEVGLKALVTSTADTKILCLQRFVRLFAYGASTLILAAYLNDLGISEEYIGLFMTLTLVGDVFISFLLTLVADNLGRRRILGLGALLMAASGVVFALTSNYWALLAAAIIGIITPRCVSLHHGMGRYLLTSIQWQRDRPVSRCGRIDHCSSHSPG